jgi:hypothetical protein
VFEECFAVQSFLIHLSLSLSLIHLSLSFLLRPYIPLILSPPHPAPTQDAHQLTLLERSKIQFSLVDIQTEDSHSDAQGGLIGDVHLSLSPLRQGVSVADVYGVQDLHGKKVADVQISIRWKRPFKKTKELAENAL